MNPEAISSYVLRFVNQTHRNIFLTGRAGTGKTTLLREIIRTTHKNTAVVAPTGIAALNAGGVTIHSLFQLPFAAFLPVDAAPDFSGSVKCETRSSLKRHFRISAQRKSVLRSLELLVIDEVSMLRADLLDALEFMLRTVRKRQEPFGGVQLLFIGDLLQLPPVINAAEWSMLGKYYSGSYFFHAHCVRQQPPLYIELTHIFRQTDQHFISILNNLRDNRLTAQDASVLNSRVVSHFDRAEFPQTIVLTTHNSKADAMNREALQELESPEFSFQAEITGDFPERIFPLDESLRLRVGAQVMLTKNDLSAEKRFYNGKMAEVSFLSSEEIQLYFPEDQTYMELEKYEWQNVKYSVKPETQEVSEEVIGTFVHYPLRLAWAITVHKSQGLTFERAALDVSQIFAPGQAYVAFSRLRSLEGLILLSRLNLNGMENDRDVVEFSRYKADEETLNRDLLSDSHRYILKKLIDCFTWTALEQQWRELFFLKDSDKTQARKQDAPWVEQAYERSKLWISPLMQFRNQLHRLFDNAPPDLDFIQQRVDAAVTYFFALLDQMEQEVLLRIELIGRTKKAKTYFESLCALEDELSRVIINLLRVGKFMELVCQGTPLSRESLENPQAASYRSAKVEEAAKKFRETHGALAGEAPKAQRTGAKKTEKAPKKHTSEITFEMYADGMSIKDIAANRQLTEQTIYNHIGQLIENGRLHLDDFLPLERQSEILELVNGRDLEGALGLVKEDLGETVTWKELRLFRSGLRYQLNQETASTAGTK